MTGISSLLAREQASDVMRSHGYRVTAASAAGVVSFAEDIFLAMRFGNEVRALADGVPTLPVTCTLRLRDREPIDQVNRWLLGKTFLSLSAGNQVCLSFHLDVTIAGGVSPAFFDQHIRHSYTHLKTLIQDARESLAGLPRSKNFTPMRDDTGPIVHIEVMGIGDLVTGRTGLLKSSRPGFTADEVALRLRACDLLEHEVLSDVAAALHAVGIAAVQIALSKSGGEASGLDLPHRPANATAHSVDHFSTPCFKSQIIHNGN